ncbi:fatty acyl-CoA reductase wat-like [Nymphalis io]|uniref:fatty acyl-CoA reductase wat-like n=1 Tax=Inachis io TaxID=171585 RepID=UPI00216A007B|nr:fatty acyl-CoA reductase wat-like [Nymphalis io]
MRSIEDIQEEAQATNDAIKKAISSGDSSVQKFYDNAVVFVTGGSGFVGKHMIEKIFRLFKVHNLVRSLSSALAYFTNNEWNFHDANTLSLHNKLSETDKVIYNCDISSVDMKELVLVWCYGVIKYIVKEDMENRSYALWKQSVLRIVHYIVLPLYLYGLFKLTSAVIKFIYFVVVSTYLYYFKLG